MDLHAITLPHNPADLRDATRNSAALYLACGVDPERANVFVQSHVPAHAELSWLLSCQTPIGWLRKMVQFKEKSKSRVSVGWELHMQGRGVDCFQGQAFVTGPRSSAWRHTMHAAGRKPCFLCPCPVSASTGRRHDLGLRMCL